MDELFEELEDVSRVQELDKIKDYPTALFGRAKPTEEKTQGNGKGKGKGKGKKASNSNEKCSGCQKPSHDEKHCWKMHLELLPQRYKERNAKRKAEDAEDPKDAKRPCVYVL